MALQKRFTGKGSYYSMAGRGGTTSMQRKIAGMDNVVRNLQREINGMKEGSIIGLVEAVEFIHADTEKTPPLTPVDTGNLRSSWSTRLLREGKRSFIMFGYTANYAMYVHELLGEINWSRRNSGAKWFQHAIYRNILRVKEIIRRSIRIGR